MEAHGLRRAVEEEKAGKSCERRDFQCLSLQIRRLPASRAAGASTMEALALGATTVVRVEPLGGADRSGNSANSSRCLVKSL